MLLLPTFNAALRPCSVGPAAFTAHERGSFCSHCQRVVQDFSHSIDPVADLAAARAASPDGQVCGSFRATQVQAPPTLTRRLKWFLVALVLVVGQGLTAREALAQVRSRAVPVRHVTPQHLARKPVQKKPAKHNTSLPVPSNLLDEPGIITGTVAWTPDEVPNEVTTTAPITFYAEQMPSFRGGGMPELLAYLQKNLRRPENTGSVCVEGKVYVGFVVDTVGSVQNVEVVKGLEPRFDAQAAQLVQSLTGFAPGRQAGRTVPVRMVVPIDFRIK